MRKWRSHKIVEAEPILFCANKQATKTVTVGKLAGFDSDTIEVPASFFARGEPAKGDYLVRYADGYLSWSPKAAFEDGYSEITGTSSEAL